MPLRKSPSFWALLFSITFLLGTAFSPPWPQPAVPNVLTWDASGYYLYLPATFIYQDLKEVTFLPEITRQYSPDPYQNQVFRDSLSGHQVMKYSMGLAVQSLPFFAAGHLAAKALNYPTDGFSPPYQVAILLGGELVAVLGLLLTWLALRRRFGEWPTALTLVIIVLGSNYLNYAAFAPGMTHSWLFTLYAALLLLTPAFYRRPTLGKALGIGLVCGLMALTRPTEILAVLLPLLWGLRPGRAALAERMAFWRQHWPKLLAAVLIVAAVGSLQLFYWHYVTGRWLVYSYQDQGFDWLNPYGLYLGLLGYRSGWLIYSPLMLTAVLGFAALRRRAPAAFWPMLVFSVLFVYVTFAWNVPYGGLGARALIQSYAVLAWPMAAGLGWVLARRWRTAAYSVFLLLGIYFNFWITYESYAGNHLMVSEGGGMTWQYLRRAAGRREVAPDARWLLDNGDQVLDDTERRNVRELWRHDFEQDTTAGCGRPALQGRCSLPLDAEHPRSIVYRVPIDPRQVRWVRVKAQAQVSGPRGYIDKMDRLIVRYCRGEEVLKQKDIRLQRALEEGWPREIYLDLKGPRGEDYDNVTFHFEHFGSGQRLLLDDVRVEAFEK
ncbi:hypothetical protein [Hymenobacter jeollabukensis]|uniref:Glycosyltransferase RgtA/B/C/D-like domain-containing protein n=1 Tax=Hymenobacter jeollabukensis TaxID=2025313 RepID=A0A5R8WLC3_9BACT|nr:hypothetical protein [Hymenobacter jeollabukensis]TLM89970.1 hypothetical protein FDY95_18270 [Hymenobacter jeollabukensis]